MLATKTKAAHPFDTTNSPFITNAVEAVRLHQSAESVIRIRAEMGTKSVVTFTAHWVEMFKKTRNVERRVYLEREANADGSYNFIFMAKPFDPQAVTRTYTEATLAQMSKDVQGYLCLSRLPQ